MFQYQRKGINRGDLHPVLDRLVDRSHVEDSECWIYEGPKEKSGHAKVTFCDKKEYLQRISWKVFRGKIPHKLQVLHKCVGTPECWNPNHLYLGTTKDNVDDRESQGRGGNHKGEMNGRSKLTEKDVLEIKTRLRGMPVDQIANMYGISTCRVYHLRCRPSWNHLGL
jgi:hypothetical protein